MRDVRGACAAQGFVPANGQSVVVTAKVEVYEPQGKLTLIAEKIEPVGLGALEEAYRRLVAELRGLGWFEPERKRALPVFPRRVAVITSAKGAALADVRNTMQRRCPGVELCLIDCLVQGGSAAPDVARAVAWVSANAAKEGIEALLVTRGGGSMEDLWAFNERIVAEAVRNCSVPVVAAIGHETDVTIVELVADARASTPTQAAMLLTPDREALRQELTQNGRRLYLTVKRDLTSLREGLDADRRHLVSGTRERLSFAATTVARLSARLERCKPASQHAKRSAAVEVAMGRLHTALRARLRVERQSLDALHERVEAVQRAAFAAAAQRLASAGRQLSLVGPVSVLQRGYSVTYRADGRVVRGPADVKAGEAMVTRLAEGRIESVVGKSLSAPLPRARKKKPADDGAGGLFESMGK
ncbi:MAG: exodeoxyribonuclease VII large subunit [Phycisphaerales bacterium]